MDYVQLEHMEVIGPNAANNGTKTTSDVLLSIMSRKTTACKWYSS